MPWEDEAREVAWILLLFDVRNALLNVIKQIQLWVQNYDFEKVT